ncbi:PAS domain S-box-containing protein [Methanosarcina thermophila]|jgi:PAS domain S-box-containing protein|uniref:histidine kinase n=3 Tax=Methanosarcina thermophila TaxID=2210 RepID=A0A1I7ACS7_METTE|nr:PAS domain S-box protein [Methanosarcina thermophila]AKB12204.1 sensory transduction histidine kinase [Methanosarcina thermophila TM-1]AKB14593.1 sensory transduction histidine kinase [Methanosarcina thermophila CHTI-55]NLU57800.1 PAS domain S-box protein [Methanosarcina thermophila]SFT72739.1 PAS domain S-box-containing protein [Methanosarcina thermophila]BAW29854.1 sensory box histidine kinase/response regulator [Methanosarcina thermophila]
MTKSDRLGADEPDKSNQKLRAEILECRRLKNELIELRDKLEAEVRDTNILHKLSMRYIEGKDLFSILQETIEAAIAITRAYKGNIQILDPPTGKLKIVAQKGFSSQFLKFFELVDTEDAATCGAAMKQMKRVVVEDITQSPVFLGSNALNILLDEGIRAVQSTPMVSWSGQFMGIISTHFNHVHTPSERELMLIDILARQTADIIENKKTEEILQESEKRYRTLFTNMTEGFLLAEVIYDKSGKPYDYRYLEVNPVYERSTGLKREQILGKSILEILPNVNPVLIEKFGETVLSGKPEHFEIFSRVTNKYFDTYVFSPDKEKVAATFRDITGRKKAEEALRESEKKYRTIVETASEGIWIVDSEARTIYINKRMTEILGYTQDEIIGKFAWDFVSEEEKPIIKKYIERRRQGISESYEFKFIRKNGSPLWTIVSSKPLFDSAGKFTGSMSMLTDITARKEAEAKLRETLDNLENLVKERTAELEKAYNLLKESKESLAEAQRLAHLGNWDLNIETGKIYWSHEMYLIFGRDLREPAPQYDEFLKYVHPEDRGYVNNALKDALSGKFYSTDYRIIRANGEERIVNMQSEVIFDEKNTPVRMRGIVQDITERKRIEKELQVSESRFRNLFEVISSGVVIYDVIDDGRDFIFRDMNPAGEQINHVRRENIVGKSLYEIFPYVSEMGLDAVFRRVWLTGKPESFPTTYYKDENIALWVTNYVYKLPSGELVAVFEDVTERKQAEEERERLLSAIQQEKDRLAALINSITDEVWFADTRKNFTLINPPAYSEFYIPPGKEIEVEKFLENVKVYPTCPAGRSREERRGDNLHACPWKVTLPPGKRCPGAR